MPREISRPCMKQSDKMSRIGSQKKKPINQTGRRTALTFRVVLLPSFLNSAVQYPVSGTVQCFNRFPVILVFDQHVICVIG